MLKGHVQIGQHLRLFRQRAQQFVGQADGVGVVQADPVQPFDPRQTAQKLGQLGLTVEVATVRGAVLADEVELADALGGQGGGLDRQALDGAAA